MKTKLARYLGSSCDTQSSHSSLLSTNEVIRNDIRKFDIVQDILNKSVPHDTLARCGIHRSSNYLIDSTLPTGISLINNHLLLTSALAVKPDIIRRLRVTSVINVTCELPDTPLPNDVHVKYLRIPVIDRNETDLYKYFDLVADTIERERKSNGLTLIHCVAGISRSASLVLAYLMKHCRMSLRSAYLLVKTKRPCIKPNVGFLKQLTDYEKRLFNGRSSVNFVYNDVTRSYIPDLYVGDYEQMSMFQKKYKHISLLNRV